MKDTAKGRIDYNDLTYVMERFGAPLECIPAPKTRYEEGPLKGQEKINPHVSRFVMRREVKRRWGKVTVTEHNIDVFHVKPIYYKHQNGGWRPISEVASHYGNRRVTLRVGWEENLDMAFLAWWIRRSESIQGSISIPSPFMPNKTSVPLSLYQRPGHAQISFSTATVYPDANPETTTVDGETGYENNTGTNISWSDIHSGASGATKQANDSGTIAHVQVESDTGSNGYRKNYRAFTLFDTSSLTSSATISAATLSLYGQDKGNSSGGFWTTIEIVTTTPASNTAITTSDYTNVGFVRQATGVSYSSFSTSAYNDFPFNATGIGNISKTGVSKFGQLNDKDLDNTEPSWENNHNEYTFWYTADQSGTSNDPKLVITYTTSTTYDQSAAAVGVGAAALLKQIPRTYAATGAGSATVKKGITMSISTLSAIGTGIAKVAKGITMSITTLAATGAGSATIAASRAYLKVLAATAAVTATTATAMVWGKVLAATGAGSAALSRTLSLFRTIAATGAGVADMETVRGIILTAVAQGVATITTTIGKTLGAVASVTARIRRDFWRTKYTAQGDDYEIKYPHGD